MPEVLHRSSQRPYGSSSGRRSYSSGLLFYGDDGLVHVRGGNGDKRPKTVYRASLIVLLCERNANDTARDIQAVPASQEDDVFPTCIACVAKVLNRRG